MTWLAEHNRRSLELREKVYSVSKDSGPPVCWIVLDRDGEQVGDDYGTKAAADAACQELNMQHAGA